VGLTEAVLTGCISLPRQVVSIFDTGARPIRRGKARADTEFGCKVLIGETDHGVITTHKVIDGNPVNATQKQSWFRRLQRFRAGSEGRISLLKRAFGLDRSLMRGDQGVAIWVGQGHICPYSVAGARIM